VAERDSYKPGTFCWAELQTTDADAAKAFYSGLLGWTHEDQPIGEGSVYTMLSRDGRQVAALYAGQQEGMPPFWASYVSVEDADAEAERARELGATVLAGPFDVMQAGRMAVIQDPQGAAVSLWQAGDRFGAQLVNAPGAPTLNQLNTSDPEAAARFYSDLFGWKLRQMFDDDGQSYWGIYNGGDLNGGMMALPPGMEAPPHWLVYFGVEDLDAAVERIGELDGQVTLPPTPVPGGRILVAQDPQGAFFALWEGNYDP
jgi:uncharacterized protein